MSKASFDLSNILLEEQFYTAFAECGESEYSTSLKKSSPTVEEYDLDGVDILDEEEDILS